MQHEPVSQPCEQVWSDVKQALRATRSIDLDPRPSYNPALKRPFGNTKRWIVGFLPGLATKMPSLILVTQEIKTTQESNP